MNKLFGSFLALAMVSSLLAWTAATANGAAVAVQASAAMLTSDEEGARQYFTDLELVTQNGQAVRFFTDVLKDRVVLINFIFTHCQDACPLISQKLLETRGLLDEAVSDRVYFISISIDPERDTPEALTEFATKFKLTDDNWVFLTGEKQNVEHIVKKLGQYDENVEEHSTLILAGNVNKRHWVKIPPTMPPVGIAEKLRLLTEDD
jgi:cytochrome oxidase Cu insertion factor (SCO1/SenC/PrrC family)